MNAATRATVFSSGKDDWETPPDLFAELDREFHFTLDVAANARNHKCDRWFGEVEDGLSFNWCGVVWLNPPYSRRQQARFIAKAAEQARLGVTVVMLIPARTDTRAFHEHIWDAEQHTPRSWVKEIRFLKGRIKFVGAEHGAPFPSMVVVFAAEPPV